MKKTRLILLSVFVLLTSCSHGSSIFPSSASEKIPSETSSEKAESSFQTSKVATDRKISFYAINDFHGAVDESGNDAGILKIGSYLKEKKKEGNTVLINSGDMFQGSLASNYNYGALLTDCMNTIEFDCMTLGNHEFDWGQGVIAKNRARKDSVTSYQTPFLGANIYRYDIDTDKTLGFADLTDSYMVTVLDNGLKVGIIGEIGTDQITSITSNYVDDLTFTNPISKAEELSDELRTQKGCDVVVLSFHGDVSELMGTGLTDVSPVSDKRYIDAAFCAHTHRRELEEENGVPFIQSACYGQYIGNVELNVSPEGNVTCHTYTNLKALNCVPSEYDARLSEIVSSYEAESDKAGDEVLGTISSYLSKGEVPLLVTEAMADAAEDAGYSIDYAVCNAGRSALYAGKVDYRALYRAIPFDNEIYIAEVKGSELRNEIQWNAMTRLDPKPFEDSKYYTIAVIDYLATHRNSSRDYDYFPSLNIVGSLTKDGGPYRYRDVTADYLRSQGTVKIDSSSAKHNTALLGSSVTL